MMPGFAPSCLPGSEMTVIMRIQEFKQNQKSTLGSGLQQKHGQPMSCVSVEQTAPQRWRQEEEGQLLLERSLTLYTSLSPQPALGKPATMFFF